MILLVEHDDSVREVLSEFLDIIHLKYKATSNPEEALQFLKTHCPNILLTDYMFGAGITASPLIEKCRQLYPSCKSVLITTLKESQAEVVARKIGADHLLLKPFDISKLESLLKELYI